MHLPFLPSPASKGPIRKHLFIDNGARVWQIPLFVSASMCLPPTSVLSSPLFWKGRIGKQKKPQTILTKADIFFKRSFIQIKSHFSLKTFVWIFFLRCCQNNVAHYTMAVKFAFRIKLFTSRGMGQTRNIFYFPLCYVFSYSWTREVWNVLKSFSPGISNNF